MSNIHTEHLKGSLYSFSSFFLSLRLQCAINLPNAVVTRQSFLITTISSMQVEATRATKTEKIEKRFQDSLLRTNSTRCHSSSQKVSFVWGYPHPYTYFLERESLEAFYVLPQNMSCLSTFWQVWSHQSIQHLPFTETCTGATEMSEDSMPQTDTSGCWSRSSGGPGGYWGWGTFSPSCHYESCTQGPLTLAYS